MLEKLSLPVNYKELLGLYNHIPEVQFWIKDTASVFIWVNSGFLENYALQSESQVIGKTDYDLSPHYMAEHFVHDDKEVLKGRIITNRIELVSSIDQSVKWCMTNKRPIYSESGKIIGSMGITRIISNEQNSDIPLLKLSQAVEFIKNNISKPIAVAQIANVMHCSVSTLERKFRHLLHTSPLEFIRKIKIQSACKMLINADLSVTQIAYNLGYADQSHFIREFKKKMHNTPHQYRKKFYNNIISNNEVKI